MARARSINAKTALTADSAANPHNHAGACNMIPKIGPSDVVPLIAKGHFHVGSAAAPENRQATILAPTTSWFRGLVLLSAARAAADEGGTGVEEGGAIMVADCQLVVPAHAHAKTEGLFLNPQFLRHISTAFCQFLEVRLEWDHLTCLSS